jgi:tetratricopeptide (TPR) repeat protein
MNSEIKQIEDRIANLEKSSRGKFGFFIQYLLSPILVVAIGVLVNFQIEKDKKELQQLTVAQSMMATLFSDDEYKTLATKRLLDEVLKDENLKTEIGNIIKDYMSSKFVASVRDGNYERATGIYEAVTNIGGNESLAIASEIQKKDQSTKALSKYQTAKINEEEGFAALLNENYALAIDKFKKAYEAYPKYHSVSEIYLLLYQTKEAMDDTRVKNKVIRKIVKNYSWKAPEKIISELRKKIDD